MAVVSTSQSLLSDPGQKTGVVIIEVWFGIVVSAQGVHEKDTTLRTILLQEQSAMLENLEAQGWRGPVQGNHVHRQTQALVQHGANLQRPGKQVCRR
jgi:hypothetical protein